MTKITDFGQSFDTMCTLPNSAIYVTIGKNYYRYSKIEQSEPDEGYPLTIEGNFLQADSPDLSDYYEGFDTMSILPDGNLYIFKGSNFIKLSWDGVGLVLAQGSLPISEFCPELPKDFQSDIDTLALLPNNEINLTKGNLCVRCTQDQSSPGKHGKKPVKSNPIIIKENYPKLLDAETFGLSTNEPQFLSGFDSVTSLGTVTYITKNKFYLRYSDKNVRVIDENPQFPVPIEIGWGI